jgi:hypothetical protein
LYLIINQPLINGATTLDPNNNAAAIAILPFPRLLRLTRAVVTRIHVRKRVGRKVRDERRRGKGPKKRVAKRRRENTEVFEESREARTVLPDRAAVRDSVEGSGARRAIGELDGEGIADRVVREKGTTKVSSDLIGCGRSEEVVGIDR